jgi:hypothetical protein
MAGCTTSTTALREAKGFLPSERNRLSSSNFSEISRSETGFRYSGGAFFQIIFTLPFEPEFPEAVDQLDVFLARASPAIRNNQ